MNSFHKPAVGLQYTATQYSVSSRRRWRAAMLGIVSLGVFLAMNGRQVSLAQGQSGASFTVAIDGHPVDGVRSFDNDGVESDVVPYQDGSGAVHLVPGSTKPGKVTVTKDWSNTSEWYKWRKAVLDGKVDRRSISVIFHNDSGQQSRVNFYNCWPSKWSGPSLNAKSSGHATEKLDISYEVIEFK